MCCRNRNQYAGLANVKLAQPMNEGDIANTEILRSLYRQRAHLRQRHLLIRLINQIQSSPSARIIAHYAVKNHDSAIFPALESGNNRLCLDARARKRNHFPATAALTGGNRATSSPSART